MANEPQILNNGDLSNVNGGWRFIPAKEITNPRNSSLPHGVIIDDSADEKQWPKVRCDLDPSNPATKGSYRFGREVHLYTIDGRRKRGYTLIDAKGQDVTDTVAARAWFWDKFGSI